MATITEYNAPGATSIIHPTETGEQATLRAATMGERRSAVIGEMQGRAFGQVGAALGRIGDLVEEHVTQSDISKQGASLIQLQNDYLKGFNEFAKTADVNDPKTFQDYYEKNWVPAINKWHSGFNTTKGAEWGRNEVFRSSEHMQNVATTEAGVAAGSAILQNMQTVIQNSVDMVGHDPSALHLARDTFNSQFDVALQNPNLTLEQRNSLSLQRPKLLAQIGESAFYARMAANPSGALDDIRGHTFDGFHMDVGRLTELATDRARQMAERASADQFRQMEIHQMQLRQQSEQTFGDWMTQNTVINPETGLPMLGPQAGQAYVRASGAMQPAQRAAAINMMDRSYDRSLVPHDDQQVIGALANRIASGDLTAARDVDIAALGKRLTPQTAAELRAISGSSTLHSLLQDPGIAGALQGAERLLTDSLGQTDPNIGGQGGVYAPSLYGTAATQSALQSAKLSILGQLSHAGSREQALQMLDPNSPTSLISRQKIMIYRDMAKNYNTTTNPAAGPGAAARSPSITWKPGMSMQELQRRIDNGETDSPDDQKAPLPAPTENEGLRMKMLMQGGGG